MDHKRLKRAGLDYHEFVNIQEYDNLKQLMETLPDGRLFGLSTKSETHYTEVDYVAGDILLFGPETRGLPAEILKELPESQRLRIPMQRDQRSLNLSNAVSILVYEAWRQNEFELGNF